MLEATSISSLVKSTAEVPASAVDSGWGGDGYISAWRGDVCFVSSFSDELERLICKARPPSFFLKAMDFCKASVGSCFTCTSYKTEERLSRKRVLNVAR